ncbi:MAG: hypothetical protein IPG28_14035 [Betaproteobacteria bacterium]|jgi:hypothetical protein|nr:hypothetical protein [Betaproteobacteria bacterium]MBK7081166.1 hypothetical protein [Betaproteobacteria bacterium]MBK7791065.1 hypothetical protein [Betaproteobacteria bacterium]MBK8687131.1 hypothetical protein [Betaproteobacteria bacterium]MBL0290408.1 hypothetical protein [Betaproteobacteria bacterium]
MPKLRRSLVASLASTLAVASFAAVAQTAPAVPPPAAPAKHSCVKPGDFPGRLASENLTRGWIRSVNGYLECLKKYIGEQQAAAKPYQEAARVYVDAANAAIEEFNTSAKEFKDQQEAAAPR